MVPDTWDIHLSQLRGLTCRNQDLCIANGSYDNLVNSTAARRLKSLFFRTSGYKHFQFQPFLVYYNLEWNFGEIFERPELINKIS